MEAARATGPDADNSHLIKGDLPRELRRLRAQPGQSVQTGGSTQLLQTLLENDLIDEYRLFIFQVMLGSGKRLFGHGTIPMALRPMASVTSEKGASCLRLARSGRPTYGQIDRQVATEPRNRPFQRPMQERVPADSMCGTMAAHPERGGPMRRLDKEQ
jgi:hypothetical protein